jgi:hypothetical protein
MGNADDFLLTGTDSGAEPISEAQRIQLEAVRRWQLLHRPYVLTVGRIATRQRYQKCLLFAVQCLVAAGFGASVIRFSTTCRSRVFATVSGFTPSNPAMAKPVFPSALHNGICACCISRRLCSPRFNTPSNSIRSFSLTATG